MSFFCAAGQHSHKIDKEDKDVQKSSQLAKQNPAECKVEAGRHPLGTEGHECKDSEPAQVECQLQQPVAMKVMSDRSNGQAASNCEHPEYGMPPHQDAEIRMVGSKAFWEYIDDKGAEVSVVRCLHKVLWLITHFGLTEKASLLCRWQLQRQQKVRLSRKRNP